MNLCELYKDTHITIRTTNTGNIYYGPIKTMYRVFNDIPIQVFYDGKWYPANIIGMPSEKSIFKINDSLMCSADLPLINFNTHTFVKNLNIGDFINVNIVPEKHFSHYHDTEIKIKNIEDISMVSEWLFGIEFFDTKNVYYTLTNGIIIPAR